MNEFTLTLSEQDMQVLTAAIGEMPFKLAAPLVNKINQQIMAQHAVNGAAEPRPQDREPLQ